MAHNGPASTSSPPPSASSTTRMEGGERRRAPRSPTTVAAVHTPRNAPRPAPREGQSCPESSESTVISLQQPRPEQARTVNLYTDTPLKHRPAHLLSPPTAITKQPSSTMTSSPSSLKKDPDSSSSSSSSSTTSAAPGEHGVQDSIICHSCGRCKCEACRTPRPLPYRWVCQDKCLVSAESVVDYCSCVCCVKALFYHCSKDEELECDGGATCADKPCSCAPHHCCLRWACMGALGVLLPCLYCYWPLRGCAKVCELLYQRVTSHGCRCAQSESKGRLLDSSGSDF